jgi:acetoin utilization protein AcuB
MTRDVIVAPASLSIADAWRILQRENIRHLPITESGRLVGIVSDRDLLCAGRLHTSGELVFPDHTIAKIMTLRPIACLPSTSVAEAARLMRDKKIDALPIVVNDRLVGLVTSTDLLSLLVDSAPTHTLPFDFRVTEAELTA